MFDSLKNKFKNIFKRGPEEPEGVKDEPQARPKEEPKPQPGPEPKEEPKARPKEEPKARPKEEPKAKPKEEKSKKVFDDDWDDDFEEDDLIPEDEWEGDPDDEEEKPAAPAKKREEPPAPKPKEAPRPAPVPEPKPAKAPEAPVRKQEEPPRPKEAPAAPKPQPEPPAKAPEKTPPVPAAPVKKAEPAPPVPVPPPKTEPPKEAKLSWKDRLRLGKQEKIAAKEAAKGKRREERDAEHSDDDLVGDKGKKIKERGLDEVLWELEVALMEADVALPVVEEIKNGVREDLMGKRHARGYELGEVVEASLKNAILKILRLNEFDFDTWVNARERPVVVMFVGINGTGKTTAIAKVANRLMKTGKTVVLAASDTFRAGAIEQLTIHAERLDCKIVKHASGADPAAVAYDAIEHARAKHRDVVLVDTAGRMQTNSNLMDEMKKIKKVAKPDLVMFVGDSLAGNDAVEQARAFDAAIGVDAIMLTKIDADSKGGAALSIAHTIGKPIAFVSNGQEYDQIVKFNAKWMMDRLFED